MHFDKHLASFKCVFFSENILTKNGILHAETYFTATLSKDTVWFTAGTIQFDNCISHSGNGYDVNTGIFTAPDTGVYFFSLVFITASLSPGFPFWRK